MNTKSRCDSDYEFLLSMVASQHLGDRIKLEWFSRSHFSFIACFRLIDNQNEPGIIVKNIMPWHLDALSAVDRERVVDLWTKSTETFREQLTELNVPLSKKYNFFVKDGYHFQISSEEGSPAHKVLAQADKLGQKKIISSVLRAIKGALEQGEEPRAGLDPQLSNFCIAEDHERSVYVDIFPPLCYFDERYFVHYPNPKEDKLIQFELARKFYPMGILRRLRFSILSIDIALEPIFLGQVKEIMGEDFYNQLIVYFDGLPDYHLNNGYSADIVKNKILSLTCDQIDDIREIGVRLSHKSDIPVDKFIERVFDLSRKDSSPNYEQPHIVRFSMLKEELAALV